MMLTAPAVVKCKNSGVNQSGCTRCIVCKTIVMALELTLHLVTRLPGAGGMQTLAKTLNGNSITLEEIGHWRLCTLTRALAIRPCLVLPLTVVYTSAMSLRARVLRCRES